MATGIPAHFFGLNGLKFKTAATTTKYFQVKFYEANSFETGLFFIKKYKKHWKQHWASKWY